MGSLLSSYFIPVEQLPAIHQLPAECLEGEFPFQAFSLSGLMQLVFLGFAYGMIVFRASNLIADGSELLLLIPSIAPVVGSLVLPVLGAVPDGTIVLFSGMGPREQVQKNLAVGVGALAGSTIMLLTVPWFLAVLAGSVDLNIRTATAMYKSKKKLSGEMKFWTETGVGPDDKATKQAARNMLITLLPYFFIQGAAFAFKPDDTLLLGTILDQTPLVPNTILGRALTTQLKRSDATVEERSRDESDYALAGMIVCALFFVGYMVQQLRGAKDDKVLKDRTDAAIERAVKKGLITLRAAFFSLLKDADKPTGGAEESMSRFRLTVLHFFKKYDTDGNGTIDRNELGLLLRDLRVPHEPSDVDHFLKEMDVNLDGTITFEEFVSCMAAEVREKNPHLHVASETGSSHASAYGALETSSRQLSPSVRHTSETPLLAREPSVVEGDDGEEEEDEEEMPEDLAGLPPSEQQKRILKRAFGQIFLGVALVIVFSDPLVEVFSSIGELCGISGFYVSFILAPLASNASEILASYSYATKKTTKTITISFCTLMGAAVLNNTFVMGIFLSLIKVRELDWEFTAETIAIVMVEIFVGVIVLTRRVHTMRDAILVLACFPASIALVAFLQSSYIGWD